MMVLADLIRLRTSSFVEGLRSSLFFVPMIGVLVAVGLGTIALGVDRRFSTETSDLSFGLTSTVESARALLSTVAGATISFAGIAFSVSLLTVQQASSQYSPRVVHALFRDPFNRRVMALVVGTFTYCVVVLRSVRTALEQGGSPVIPNLSVAIGVLLGIVTILAVVAFIDHSTHDVDISEILAKVTGEAVAQARREWSDPGAGDRGPERAVVGGGEPVCSILFERSGWVQRVDAEALHRCVPEGTTMRVEAHPGHYAVPGASVCTLSAIPDDLDRVSRQVRDAVTVGATRTMQQDVSYGLRQLEDVALKALSPGINDPTTAQDAIFHLVAVLVELLGREPPARVRSTSGSTVILSRQPTHASLVQLSFDEVRRAASTQPTVCIYLLVALDLLRRALGPDDSGEVEAAIADQTRLVLAGCEAAGHLPSDLQLVRIAYDERFAVV